MSSIKPKPLVINTPKTESEKSYEWVQEQIEKKLGMGFYGSLTLHFQDGCIKIIEENHSMRPPYRE